ncbi:MAG: LysM peptidoglycan-binding domain-containing protein [SAR324 cluster bacterium]|nr:LysM peptidoglycan-binding domain-containing protein [SAR324 cluster bacterium]
MLLRWIMLLAVLWTIPGLAFALGGPSLRQALADSSLRQDFPSSPLIDRQKAFWIRIFTEVHSNGGLLHDGALTQPVYDKLLFGDLTRRQQHRIIRKGKKEVSIALRGLADALDQHRPLDRPQRDLLARFPNDVDSDRLREAAGSVRFQRGLADRFEKGLIVSGAYLGRIKAILQEHGVPEDLAYLPHVESSFNYHTYSKAGAAGIWQFTRGTGKMYMNIGYEVDERLDPFISTRAAAKFLKSNYSYFSNWPVAITAYNHGRQNLVRIVKKMGTSELTPLIIRCGCRLFKFASKNFYAEFLAAREVAKNPTRYFGPLTIDPPVKSRSVKLQFYMDFQLAARLLNVSRDQLAALNLSLRPPVLQSTKYMPKGYTLRIPHDRDPETFLATVPKSEQHRRQRRTTEVIVARGDTLYDIGRRFNVSWQLIARANNISAYRRIRPGQRLLIPGKGSAAASAKQRTAAVASTTVAVPSATARRPLPAAARSAWSETIPSGIAFQIAEGASLFQDLDLHFDNVPSNQGEIVSAYGETLGHYADWAGVPTRAIRGFNDYTVGRALRPGDRIRVPITPETNDSFLRRRMEFHRSREEDFFSTYAVTEMTKIRVRRGDTVWLIAQSNNVPMWLFYQQNPELIGRQLKAGEHVYLPLIVEISDLQDREPVPSTGQAG